MKSVLIVYHSMTGGTLQMAHAAAAGARSGEGLRVSLLRAADAQAKDVLEADGYIFATPENLAGMSGMMKDFFDRTYYAALERINGRPYLVLICAGSDGRNAAQQIDRIATGWRLKPIADPYIVCTHAQTPEQILKPKKIDEPSLLTCEELGKTLGSGIAMGIF
ncbi:MAG TPA: NAD(P)H-dependent oxidoreductase [Steroidobacteraceae bacterium]|nr:NAD(P)H-dependent oxidoreductase [Steroidobacteraceae bacterium]